MNALRLFLALAMPAALLFAQGKPKRPEFEVASVRPAATQAPTQAAVGLHIDGAQVRINYLPLRDYVQIAYHVRSSQVTGPDWIATERYDVAAKIPEGGKPEQIRDMLQALLEDRFQMKVRRES